MADNNKESKVVYQVVYRTLAETVYLVRFWYIRLTEEDVALLIFIIFVIWGCVDGFGLKNVQVWIFKLDPWAYIWIGALSASVMSLANRIRPDAGLPRILRGMISAKLLTPRTLKGDRAWHPSQRSALIRGDWPEGD
ncbi:MAG TPA: hypothetical protein VJZ91_19590 [Blastocatellia bacterium]|nr:hypothetical protein [Blastocatellia bacterium]